MKIATIDRAPHHSPRMQESDAAIMRLVEKELTALGAEVKNFKESDNIPPEYKIILHMSRTADTLQRLNKLKNEGYIIINTPDAVNNCTRINLTNILQENNIPQPEHIIIEQTNRIPPFKYPAWIKKGNGWSCRKEDVAYITTPQEAKTTFDTIKANGGTSAILCKHIEGDIIKFYGVGNTFFKYIYPDVENTKFGLEKINGAQKKHPFDTKQLQETALKAAAAPGLEIFGGDAIITPQGEIFIIDINDFPSFSQTREEAAHHIAAMLINKTKKTL